MRNYKLPILLLFTSITCIAVAAIPMRPVETQSDTSQNKKQRITKAEFEKQFPITDYETAGSSDPVVRAKRKAISRKFNNADQAINENVDTIFSAVDWEKGLPALPVEKSQVVVLGKVVDAQAYLSDDKTAVYSEFTVEVGQILKNDTPNSILPQSTLTAQRSGGRVRLPSGGIVLQLTRGQGMPQVGRQYVLFLQTDDNQNFLILTGYEFKDELIAALDSPGGNHPITKYNGVAQSVFLSDLQKAVSNRVKAKQGVR